MDIGIPIVHSYTCYTVMSYLVYESVLVPGLHRACSASANRVHSFRHVYGSRYFEFPDANVTRDHRTRPPGTGAAVHHVRTVVGLHVRPGLRQERQHCTRIGRHALHGPTAVP